MIVGLVSCYEEGLLAAAAVDSLLPACDRVHVADGPIGDAAPGGLATGWQERYRREQRVSIHYDAWESDAGKRSWLLAKTRRYPAPTWGVIVDGDELLVHGEQIPALIEYREAQADAAGQVALNVPLRLVEADGSVGFLTARVLRLDLIERWLISSYHILLRSRVEVSLPNAYPLQCGEPDRRETEPTTGLQIRRPHQGEAHILHRPGLRAPQRSAERQSAAEGTVFDSLVREAGLGVAHGERPRDDRPAIWLPQ